MKQLLCNSRHPRATRRLWQLGLLLWIIIGPLNHTLQAADHWGDDRLVLEDDDAHRPASDLGATSALPESLQLLHDGIREGAPDSMVNFFLKQLSTAAIDINLPDAAGKTLLDHATAESVTYRKLVEQGAQHSHTLYGHKKSSDRTSPETLHTHLANLKTEYGTQDSIPPLLGDTRIMKLSECYIRLALMHQEELEREKQALLDRSAREHRADELPWQDTLDLSSLTKEREQIELDNIWDGYSITVKSKNEDGEEKTKTLTQPPAQRVLIVGEAGTGKTTLTRYLTLQWSRDQLWKDRFQWILKIPLRHLHDIERVVTEAPQKGSGGFDSLEAIDAYLGQQLAATEVTTAETGDRAQLGTLITALRTRQLPGKGLLILDGYDEVATRAGEEGVF